MSGAGGTAIATIRLTHDAWRRDDVDDIQCLKRLLADTEPGELRSTVEHVCRLTVGLAVLLEETQSEFSFDRWLADEALDGISRDAA